MYEAKQQNKVVSRTLQSVRHKFISCSKLIQRSVWLYGYVIKEVPELIRRLKDKRIHLTDKQVLQLQQLVDSQKEYEFADLKRILGIDKRTWKPTGSIRSDRGSITPKPTEAGFSRMPGKIKAIEQPGDASHDLIGAAVIGVNVKKNNNYHNITTEGKVELVENQTYLWVEKPDGSIIIGDEKAGLGHPTLALDLSDSQSKIGTAGMARIGGELTLRGGIIYIDNRSGRYGKGRVPANLHLPQEKLREIYNVPVIASIEK